MADGAAVGDLAEQVASRHGPVAPHAGAACVLRPLRLGDARVTGGFWAGRQEINRRVSLPAARRQLEEAGNFANLRRAASGASNGFRGRVFNDSDVYKWLEALAWEQGREPSAEFAGWQQEATALIASAQLPDGYLNTYYQLTSQAADRYTDLSAGHELYCAGHLIQAAVAQARATGQRGLLQVAEAFAAHVAATFGPGKQQGVPGHPAIEMALVELFRLTGNRLYLDTASYFVEARGDGLLGPGRFGSSYYQDHVKVRQARSIEGHAVRIMFLLAGVTDLYAESGDRGLLEPLIAQWEDMVSGKTYLTGGIGSRWKGETFGEPFELPSDRAYCETCAAHASILWNWRLLLATGEARFADLIERTLFNAFLAGVSLDGERYFYANPLQMRSGAHTTAPRSPNYGRQPWYETACCPPNVMRTLASLDHYLSTQTESGIQVHQYADSLLTARLGQHEIGVRVATDYPWNGDIEIEVTHTRQAPWTLSLRVPAWAADADVQVNGHQPAEEPIAGSYLNLHRRWARGDRIVLTIPTLPRLTKPSPRIDSLRGMAALEKGPLVYCLEEIDQEASVAVDGVSVTGKPQLASGSVPIEGLDAMEVAGISRPLEQVRGLPYGPADAHDDERKSAPATNLVAIPYFAWANRGVGPMRVWIPQENHET